LKIEKNVKQAPLLDIVKTNKHDHLSEIVFVKLWNLSFIWP